MASFKRINGYEEMYAVSDQGEVYSFKKLKPRENNCGYLCVVLCKDGEKPKQKFIHRLVAEAFLPTNDYTLQVNHKDSNRKNNKIDNLEWCSVQYNNMLAHAKRVEQYDLYGNKLAEYASVVVASNITGVSASSISHCCRKDTKTSGGFIWKYTEE